MAKIGEGDPRWIVQERDDGRNVNAWHWTEKNVSDWVKDTLQTALEEQALPASSGVQLQTKALSECDCECNVYNRKGKIYFLLELKFTLAWEAQVTIAGVTTTVQGKVEVSEIDHDTTPERMPLQIRSTESGEAVEAARRVVATVGFEFIRSKFSNLIAELKQGHGVTQSEHRAATAAAAAGNIATKPEQKPDPRVSSSSFEYTIEWFVPASEIWAVLTDERRVSAYTRAPAKLSAVTGGEFAYFNGAITGKFTSVDAPHKLVMQWRMSEWSDGYYSTVNIALKDLGGNCRLQLSHTGIPFTDLERTKVGWRNNFWEPIKMVFGYGFSWKSDEE